MSELKTVTEQYLKYAQEKMEKEAMILQTAVYNWVEEIKSQPRDFSKKIILKYNHEVASFLTNKVKDIICTLFNKAFDRKVIWFDHTWDTIHDDTILSYKTEYKCEIMFDNTLKHQLEILLTQKKKIEEQEQEILKKIKLDQDQPNLFF